LRTQFERAHVREKALDDLTSGGAFMKLAPVTAWFVRDRPKLKVVETAITVERLGICVRNGNTRCATRSTRRRPRWRRTARWQG